ncbi:hypothetical protein NE237_012615 [Protea cynaroides]|uniref:Uncharacterized protein n=1 Tax=Protea cynaroides TaxID=273540 RepID=A0A9Q0JY66_9MAGN|nr:hypothetical protein NE237_012615 [Protea cynaroides]
MMIHGCDPFARCPLLPARPHGLEIKRIPPTAGLIEKAKFIDLQGSTTRNSTPAMNSSGGDGVFRRKKTEASLGKSLQLTPPSSTTSMALQFQALPLQLSRNKAI